MSEKRWIDDVDLPVDPDVFMDMLQVWQDSAEQPLRPDGWAPNPGDPPGYVLTDIPMNRSGLRVVGALRERGVEPAQAYLVRVMHFHEIVDAQERFSEFIKPSDEPGALSINENLLKAAALAKFVAKGDRMGFDLDDVLAQAQRLQAEEDGGDVGA